jgi:hypothetical protein
MDEGPPSIALDHPRFRSADAALVTRRRLEFCPDINRRSHCDNTRFAPICG